MIFITGDTHGNIDIHKLNSNNFPEQKQMTKNDFVIITGDFGGVWNRSEEEIYWLKWLNDKSFTTLFVDGNHENFDLLNSYDVGYFYGGKVHRILANIYHLMRGQVFEINGTKIFTMGGATSIDKQYRRENISWWKEELPSCAEYEEALSNLEKHNYIVDYVLTHTCSKQIMEHMEYLKEDNSLNSFFDILDNQLQYKHWYFGHFHQDRQIDKKHSVVYNNIVKLR